MISVRSKFITNMLSVGLAQLIVLGLNVVLIRLLEIWFGSDGLGQYLVAGRVSAMLFPLLLMGLDIALARAVALEPERGRALFGLGALILSSSSVAFLFIGLLARDPIGSLVFGRPGTGSLFFAAVLFAVGYAFLTLWYSVLRGFQRMRLANTLQVAYLIIEIGSAYFVSQQIGWRHEPISAFLALSSLGILVLIWVGGIADGIVIKWDRMALSGLLQYGGPRVPSGFFLSALFSIPVFLASSQMPLQAATIVGLGVMLVRIAEIAVAPLGTMLLPKLSEIARPGNEAQLARTLNMLLGFVLHIGLLASLLTPGLIGEIITIWLGPKYVDAVQPLSIIMFGAGPYVAYTILRNALNAISARPYVTWLTLSSVLTTLASGLVLARIGPEGLAISLVLGLCVLGLGSFGLVLRLSRTSLGLNEWLVVLPILLGGAIVAGSDVVLNGLPVAFSLSLKIAFRGMVIFIVTLFLRHRKVSWSLELRDRIMLQKVVQA